MATSHINEDNPRQVSVTVVIEKDTGQSVVRLVSDPNSAGIPVAQDHVLQFNNNQNDQFSKGFLVSFHLPTNQGKNADWEFADDPPIWVKLLDKKGACPRTARDHDPNILTSPILTDNNRTLTVTNTNSTKQYFGFALRFKYKKGGRRPLVFDPIGDNQNGDKGLLSRSYLIYAGVAVGAGIVSALVTTAALRGFRLI